MSLPLSHIRVVEMAQLMAAPMTAMHLADQGAEVIKIESPEGDGGRQGTPGETPGMASRILAYSRNKRAIVVDFTKPNGLEIVRNLVRQADVLVINVRLGARQRHGLTYEDLAAINPRLVYASITGYGDEGPDADQPGSDSIIQARSGDLMARRPPDGPPPDTTALYHFDMATALMTFGGVMLALYERERTGKGQRVETNLLQSAVILQAIQLTRVKGMDQGRPARSNSLPSNYLCSDGRYVHATVAGARWAAVCKALGLAAVAEDPRFNSQEKRQQNEVALHDILVRHFVTRPAAEWDAMLKAEQQNVPALSEIADLYSDPQVIANDMMIQFDQPGMGWVQAVNAPFKLSEHLDDRRVRRPVPTLGQHTEEVLQELGYSKEKIEALKKEKVVT